MYCEANPPKCTSSNTTLSGHAKPCNLMTAVKTARQATNSFSLRVTMVRNEANSALGSVTIKGLTGPCLISSSGTGSSCSTRLYVFSSDMTVLVAVSCFLIGSSDTTSL
ncbi:OPI6 [Saccharomyces cerevisiae synthetic construct]|uniref:Putative uncharacterized protein OPI6 n=2 Tax=Saccharomyces cerevisiae TaxID=4932 RepID=OPI6_YEAST|nr:RecName: Full=Putative uncharacterized protein OPI6 [Saccharomyces cerevisiae S288C]AAT93352.1 YDL096C [Saccharomyces cerevisiae]WNF19711.1 OPI6 [Saccharomyces cerevisiae synthetic construct]CAY78413.1 Opi6p [Saccharomyces cerevisiae EC1118]KZV12133.1 hypothetical protein WN66_00947 [Saccharomyces cerevisiae]CAA98662.1 unnamed protein product [Saccharomyces cerevisiae]